MSKVKIGDYIFQRLKQLGVGTCWGVPGDYELALLDLVGDAGIKFSGNANELIASYSADGYARINGVGAFITTYGPGELSAYCGHAGAYAEYVPVAHIVGYPGVTAMKNHTLMHHSLGTGEFGMYHKMVAEISVATAVLTDPATAASEIDRCLNTMLHESRPVYIGVPVDVSHAMIDGSGLKTPLVTQLPPNDADKEAHVVEIIASKLEKAKYPVIIVDGNTNRNGLNKEADRLAEITGVPYFATAMGKGGPNEDLPNFGGIYGGGGSAPAVRKAVEDDSDLVLYLGSFRTDFNTGEFTDNVKDDVSIDLQRFHTRIGHAKYDVGIKGVLTALLKRLENSGPLVKTAKVPWEAYPYEGKEGENLSQDYLWDSLKVLFRPGDIIVTETGTSAFGSGVSRIPKGAFMYNQTVFGSIGYAGPSATGAFQAATEKGKLNRGILITGEGSLQLTPMCFADMLKLRLKSIAFVLNNNGYTIERLIHGADADYNLLPYWDYDQLRTVFGPMHPSKYHGPIQKRADLEKLLVDPEFNDFDGFQLVELKLETMDAPISVKRAAAAVEAFNQKFASKD